MKVVPTSNQVKALESVLLKGDLRLLNDVERLNYYNAVCDSLGLNPLTRPFEYMELNGKLVLYAKRDATDQLRSKRKVSVKVVSREQIGDVFIVTAQATMPDGRTDESVGAVPIAALKGAPLANAFMKAETKAKRRVTLSICGLGMLDETEVDSIAEAKTPVTIIDERKEALPEPELDPEHDDEDPGSFVVPFGKTTKGKTLNELGPDRVRGLVDWFTEQAKEKPLSENAIRFIKAAELFL